MEKRKANKRKISGVFSWLKNKSKIKRWLFLILISAISICASIAIIMTNDAITVNTIIKIILLFAIGAIGIVYGNISIQKRTLEIMVKETDKTDSVKALIYDKKVYNQGPKIVVIGGGSGLNSVLKGLKKYSDNITAIVTMTQSQSNELNDIEEAIVSLAKEDKSMKKFISQKMQLGNGKVSFLDIYLMVMESLDKKMSKSVENIKDIFNITGKVLPVTDDKLDVCVELTDGTVIRGKYNIENDIQNKTCEIKRAFLNPTNCRIAPGVEEAIKSADAIIIGPGNLYTNVIPNLLVNGVTRAIKNSSAFKVYVSNIMTEAGQTDNYTLSDHINALKKHIGEGTIDFCIYDTGDITPEYIRKYNMKGSELVEQDIQRAKATRS